MRRTLVLIGFSGNDPNFIQWLGWVKDALNENQRKVYLLSLDPISEASRKTFENKKVIVVDIRGFAGKGSTYTEDIEAAIKYLEDYPDKRERDSADYRAKASSWGRSSYEGLSIEAIIARWRIERETYPGWLIIPRDRREYWANIDRFTLCQNSIAHLLNGEDLIYLDLFNWRIEKCVFPIENVWESIYLDVLSKYRPFAHRSRQEIRLAWINLKLGLLRLYRQEGWRDKWENLRNELLTLKGRISDEQRCRFEYEQALEAIYRNDFVELEGILNGWDESKTDYYWDVRRGALWAEYISLDKGREITKRAFNLIREEFDASAEENDRFYWASRLVNAHTVWESMSHANFTDAKNETESARVTWIGLRPYEDIWYEREFFESHIRSVEDVLRVKTKTASFRLGYSSTSTNMSGNSKDYRVAYAYFLYYEEMGFPIHLPYLNAVDKKTLGKALSVMAWCSPSIADCWLLRSGDASLVQYVYNRRFLERTSCETVNTLFVQYLDCLNRLLKEEQKDDPQVWTLAFRSVLPEILSRLCMKASYESRIRALDLIDAIFRSKESIRYEGLDTLIHCLVVSFSKEEAKALIPRFVGMSVALDRFDDCRLEPLLYTPRIEVLPASVSEIVDNLIRDFGKNKNAEKAILFRLMIMYQCGALSKKQQDELSAILWNELDVTGFPSRTCFSRFAFLSMPHPKGIEPQSLLRDYFMAQSLPVMGKGSSISFYGGHIPVFNDIKGTTNSDISFDWDKTTINTICERLIVLWDTDKGRMLEAEQSWSFSVRDELRNRLEDVEVIVSTVMAPNIQMLSSGNKSGIKRMADEFENYGLPSLRMRIALGVLCEKEDLDGEIKKRMNSSDRHIIVDSIRSVLLLCHMGKDVIPYVELISDYFRSNAELGRGEIIWGLNLFINHSFLVEHLPVRQNLILGLERLFDDTKIDKTDDEIAANNKMYLRMSVAPIVRALLIRDVGEAPQSLLIWKAYYENEETCWDVKNAFC